MALGKEMYSCISFTKFVIHFYVYQNPIKLIKVNKKLDQIGQSRYPG